MKSLVLASILIGNLTITSYRAIEVQTDSSPSFTSTGEHVRAGGVAISRDLLCGACRKLHHRCKRPDSVKKIHYGDWLYIENYGFRQVNDVMGESTHYKVLTKHGYKTRFIEIRNAMDIFVEKWSEEHAVGVRHLNVFKVRVLYDK